MKGYLLGIDIGTSGAKGIIGDLDGNIISSHTISYEVSMPHKCWAEHDANKIWWDSFKTICREMMRKGNIEGKEILAVGCSGLGPSMVPIDNRGDPLRPAILYGIDTRSDNEIKYCNKLLGLKKVLETSGQKLSSQSVGTKILWYKNNESDRYSKTTKILTANGFIIYKLTGKYSIDICSAIFFCPLFNLKMLSWDFEISKKVGISIDILPELYHPSKIVGTVTGNAVRDTGLAEGTPVIAGAVDAFAEAVGASAVEEGDIYLSYATTMTIIINSCSLKIHPELWANMHYIPDIYTLIGGMATSGALTKWFIKNFINRKEKEFIKKGTNIYDYIISMAERVPAGSEGLIILPYFSGERTPINDNLARGIIAGLTLSHTREHIYRAILEGTAYSVAHHLDIIKNLNIYPKKIISSGGGIENRAWTQIVSDVTGLKQICIGEKGYSASIGNAYMAGFGAGIFKDFSVLKEKWANVSRVIEPDIEKHKKYVKYIKIYKNLYKNTKRDIHNLAKSFK